MSTPITGLYAGVLALLILVLAIRVVLNRRASSVDLGDGGNAALLRRIRIHGNAVEYIPIALILILLLEMNGTSAAVLHALGVLLVIGRLAHVQGISQTAGASPGRLFGNIFTWISITVGAVLAIGLSFAA